MSVKLVKARVKAIEELPDWFVCCGLPRGECLMPLQEELLDIGDCQSGQIGRCSECGAPQPETLEVTLVRGKEEFWVPLVAFDLDEGPTA